MASYEEFLGLEMRVGTVVRAEVFAEARNPALKLWIDFGEYGVKQSSAQITRYYAPQQLVGRQVVGVTNFPVKKVAGFPSQVLVLGAMLPCGPAEAPGQEVVLLRPDREVPPGTRVL